MIKKPETTLCWAVVDAGKVGTENQLLGLAAAMGLTPVVKRVSLKFPWHYISPPFLWGLSKAIASGSPLQPPWPEIVLSGGRAGALAALAIKQQSQGRTFVAHVMDPRISPARFDAMVVPQHDRARGSNICVTIGSVHGVTPAQTQLAATHYPGPEKQFPHPRVAVLLGGNSSIYRLSTAGMVALLAKLEGLVRQGASLMITASRRTGEKNLENLREWMRVFQSVRVWDGHGDNPYLAYLGLADFILVTEDSVSMLSEACALGKPVYTLPLDGGSSKFKAFHQALYDQGYARPFAGTLESWPAHPLEDTARAAAFVWQRFKNFVPPFANPIVS